MFMKKILGRSIFLKAFNFCGTSEMSKIKLESKVCDQIDFLLVKMLDENHPQWTNRDLCS